ncbi:aspartate-ammonia ligase [Cruoricaptor ignavus]|uniref:Aspartate--ammonia ligase n=1 Tax=Cruoricaptor ignavus TaxID=1118202 RepID=A0A1M6BXZ4_9FLAO|nr:aspartate--ammonia ligase [Cruoricaptor ignavus]SHI53580.1 aspartate-ammonia ligase [Cruoricaptor ignavus]
MKHIIIPESYRSDTDLYRTQHLIKLIKDFFQINLAHNLNLKRVSAPLFVASDLGLNDNLSGNEQPVNFTLPNAGEQSLEIVHSLAKWKRAALKRYNFQPYEGLYTDMNAIRRCEIPDNTHSFYVDQWDWEKIILPGDRNLDFLKNTVDAIFRTLKALDEYLNHFVPGRRKLLDDEIYFITSEELLQKYPNLSPEKREREITKEKKAVFLMQIGAPLSHGEPHGSRAPDYDDWLLNGDILVYNPVLDDVLELSSMGIRVDGDSLSYQLKAGGNEERKKLPFHRELLQGSLPQTIGGGIGQSRLCMFFLQKAHIGEVQASYWPEEMREYLEKKGILLL